MSKIITLKKSKEFKKVFDKGRSLADKNVVIYFLDKKSDHTRIGFVVSKKMGNAVRRNRIRRLLREAFRLNMDKIQNQYDMVVLPRANIHNQDFKGIEQSILKLCKRAGIYPK